MHLLNTLYVTTPESRLRLDNDTLRVETRKKPACACPCTICKRWSASGM